MTKKCPVHGKEMKKVKSVTGDVHFVCPKSGCDYTVDENGDLV